MKLPKCTVICGKRWRFVYTDKPIIFLGRKRQGLCDNNKKTITIYLKQSPIALLETIYHEVQHAAHFSGGYRWSHDLIYATSRPLARISKMMMECDHG